jgi:hypothetical protein
MLAAIRLSNLAADTDGRISDFQLHGKFAQTLDQNLSVSEVPVKSMSLYRPDACSVPD